MSMLHFFVNCEWAFLFSMKPDLYPPLPPSYITVTIYDYLLWLVLLCLPDMYPQRDFDAKGDSTLTAR